MLVFTVQYIDVSVDDIVLYVYRTNHILVTEPAEGYQYSP